MIYEIVIVYRINDENNSSKEYLPRRTQRQTGFSRESSRTDANEEPTFRKKREEWAPSILLRRNIYANKGKDSNSLFHGAHPPSSELRQLSQRHTLTCFYFSFFLEGYALVKSLPGIFNGHHFFPAARARRDCAGSASQPR